MRSNQRKGSILLINGIDVSVPGEYIADNSARNSENFDVSRSILTKRPGTSRIGGQILGTDKEIMGGREFLREGVRYNVRVGLEAIEKYNTVSSEWDYITGEDITMTGTTVDIVSIATPMLSGSPILTISNGKDPIIKWTATGDCDELGGTPPVAKFIQEYKTYLVCANIQGGTDIGQRVQWSDTADPETWDSGNAGFLDLVEDGGDITGLTLFGNYLCVHKNESIYLGFLISGVNIFQFDRKSTGVGTIANGSIQNLPTGEQIFLARDGIHVFNGITAPIIDSAVNDEIRDGLNKEYAYKSWSVLVPEKDEVWIGLPIGGQTTGETVYKYNYITKKILKDIRSNVNCAWKGVSTAGLSWDDIAANWDNFTDRWDDTGLNVNSDVINLATFDGYTYVLDSGVLNDEVVSYIDHTLYNDADTEYDSSVMDYDGVTTPVVTTGNIIEAIWETKDFQDSQQQLSRWQYLELWAKGGSVSVEYSPDGGVSWYEASNSPATLTDEYPLEDNPLVFYFDVVSSKIRFRFINKLSETLAIKQFIVAYVPREFRR